MLSTGRCGTISISAAFVSRYAARNCCGDTVSYTHLQAKQENSQQGSNAAHSSVSHRRSITRRCGIAAAAAAAALVILPNTSASVAYAMSQVPVLSRLVEVVTFRDYHYEDDRNSADILVPEVTVAPDTDADTDVYKRQALAPPVIVIPYPLRPATPNC